MTNDLNPVELAEHNLNEAKRQLKQAELSLAAGDITPERYHGLATLADVAEEDYQRVLKEN